MSAASSMPTEQVPPLTVPGQAAAREESPCRWGAAGRRGPSVAGGRLDLWGDVPRGQQHREHGEQHRAPRGVRRRSGASAGTLLDPHPPPWRGDGPAPVGLRGPDQPPEVAPRPAGPRPGHHRGLSHDHGQPPADRCSALEQDSGRRRPPTRSSLSPRTPRDGERASGGRGGSRSTPKAPARRPRRRGRPRGRHRARCRSEQGASRTVTGTVRSVLVINGMRGMVPRSTIPRPGTLYTAAAQAVTGQQRAAPGGCRRCAGACGGGHVLGALPYGWLTVRLALWSSTGWSRERPASRRRPQVHLRRETCAQVLLRTSVRGQQVVRRCRARASSLRRRRAGTA